MASSEPLPIACMLTGGDYQQRLDWIASLTRDALLRHQRRDLALDLHYAPEAVERVREMVRREQGCCGFLKFDLMERPDMACLTITVPQEVRDSAETLLAPFVAGAANPAARRHP